MKLQRCRSRLRQRGCAEHNVWIVRQKPPAIALGRGRRRGADRRGAGARPRPGPHKVVESLGAPPSISTSFGKLEFKDGVPSVETAEKTFDLLTFS